jgi:hypothetical protein
LGIEGIIQSIVYQTVGRDLLNTSINDNHRTIMFGVFLSVAYFTTPLSAPDLHSMDRKTISEAQTGRDLEGSGCGLIDVYPGTCLEESYEKSQL